MHTTPRCLPRKKSQGHFVTCLNDALLPPFSDHIELGQIMREEGEPYLAMAWQPRKKGPIIGPTFNLVWRRIFSIKEHDTVEFWLLLFPLLLCRAKFCRKKSVFERVFLFVPTTRACPLLLLFCARATGQLSNVCYLCWRSLVIKTGLVVVLLLCSASVNSIQIQTFSMKKRKKNWWSFIPFLWH